MLSGRSIGVVLLAIWLICEGAIAVLSLTFQGIQVILGVLAIIAGILLLIGR
jgi:hypothetical protein